MEDNFSMDWGWRGWFGDDSSIYYTLYFYYYYINSTSDHQVLDPESWGPLPYMMLPFYSVNPFFLLSEITNLLKPVSRGMANELL